MPENMLKYVGKKFIRKDAGRSPKAIRYYAVDVGIKR
jgi:hypothetical protein